MYVNKCMSICELKMEIFVKLLINYEKITANVPSLR